MFNIILVALFLTMPLTAYADFDFSEIDNLETVKKENDEKKERETIFERKKRNDALMKIKREKRYMEATLKNKKLDEKISDKKRDHAYQDRLRAAELKMVEAKANRVNDYIDSELANEKAKTDVVQSDADRARMKGKAEIIRAENPQDVDINITVEEK